MKTCPNCGNQIPVDTVKFCYECGYKFNESGSPSINTPVAENFDEPLPSLNFNFDEPSEESSGLFDGFDVCDKADDISFDFSSLKVDNHVEEADVVIDSGLEIKNGVLLKYNGKNKKVTIPNNVTKIRDAAFYGNDYIEHVVVGSGVKEIGIDAFSECYNLRCVSLPQGLRVIADHAFAYSDRLSIIDIPSTVREIGENAFEQTGIKEASIPGAVGVIKDNTFSYCKQLKKVIIGEGVTAVEMSAFEGCRSLINLTLPTTIKRIENSAFGDIGITSLNLPRGIKEISDYAFYECQGITEVRIPKSVIELGNEAFDNCYSLEKIYVPDHLNFSLEYSNVKAKIIFY